MRTKKRDSLPAKPKLNASGQNVRKLSQRQVSGNIVNTSASGDDTKSAAANSGLAQQADNLCSLFGTEHKAGCLCPDCIASGYATLLNRYPWSWFVTETHRDNPHPESALKRHRFWISNVNRSLWGRNWHRKGKGLDWVVGLERHRNDTWHLHALVAGPFDLNQRVRRMDWVDWWWKEYGICRIEPVRDHEQACSYVAKYVAKGGEVEFSPNLRALGWELARILPGRKRVKVDTNYPWRENQAT